MHDVAPGGNDDAAENDIGGEDLGLGAIDGGPPPRIPDIVEQENSAAGSIHLHENFGVGVFQQPGTAGRRSTAPAKSRRGMLQQHRPARINIGPAATQDLGKIGKLPLRDQHHARQRARILIDVRILGMRKEFQVARLERRIDLVDRHAGGDEPHPQKICKSRMIRRIKR